LESITAIWYILWSFGNLVPLWYIFPRFGKVCQEKSGNPAFTALPNVGRSLFIFAAIVFPMRIYCQRLITITFFILKRFFESGLPDRIFSHQNSPFGYILEGLGMMSVVRLHSHLVYFLSIWYILRPFGIFQALELAKKTFITSAPCFAFFGRK
jgi:hypothetical protein